MINRRYILIVITLVLFICSHVLAQLPELIAEIPSDTTHMEFGARIVPMGDQNDDGYDDFLVYRRPFVVLLYYGSDPFDTTPDLRFDSLGTPYNLGDVNGDGYDDFAAYDRANPKVSLFYGGPGIDDIPDLRFGLDTMFAVHPFVLAKDLNQDGTDELVAREVTGYATHVYELGLNPDSVQDLVLTPANLVWNHYISADGLVGTDLNGDHIDDLGVSIRPGAAPDSSGWVHLYWGGSDFDTIPDMTFYRPGDWVHGEKYFGMVFELLGDVNGDSHSDFLVSSGSAYEDTVSFVYFGGPNIDTMPDIVIPSRLERARMAGDVNNDGYDDFIVSDFGPVDWYGNIRVYYGGPSVDSNPDVVIHNSDMPQYQTHFGLDCSGVGDVNGDGIDDFAFSTMLSGFRAAVYVFSGTSGGSDVGYDFDPRIPDDFSLSQNYPNPFNPSTVVEFSVPVRSHVNLTVFNILGQEVVTLVDREIKAGTHAIEWDGKSDGGDELSTGVYFYRLIADGVVQSRKMVMVK